MSKNREKSKLSNNALFNANKHVFNCEKSLGTFVQEHKASASKKNMYSLAYDFSFKPGGKIHRISEKLREVI
jgi:hypothetical protein